MMRARRIITLPDDDGDDGVAVPTWIMGIPYTGEVDNREGKQAERSMYFFRVN